MNRVVNIGLGVICVMGMTYPPLGLMLCVLLIVSVRSRRAKDRKIIGARRAYLEERRLLDLERSVRSIR